MPGVLSEALWHKYVNRDGERKEVRHEGCANEARA